MNTQRTLLIRKRQLKNRCIKYGTVNLITECKTNDCVIKAKEWKDKIELSQDDLFRLTKAGFLVFSDFPTRTITPEVLEGKNEAKIDTFLLLGTKSSYPIAAIFLIATGIIFISVGLLMLNKGAVAHGTVSFSRYGNSSGDYKLPWNYFVAFGVGLLGASFYFINFRGKRKKK